MTDDIETSGYTLDEILEMCDDLIVRYTKSHVVTDTAVIVAKVLKNRLLTERATMKLVNELDK